MPKVSVIVPVYGVEKYIERCARSLFEQTLDDIEYLFIDDCTPDRSIEVLETVLEDYPQRKLHVTIHRMEQNSGQAKVREWGVKRATGEYVIHCDSDDWVDTEMYKTMYDEAKRDNLDMVVCDVEVTDGKQIKELKIGCCSHKIDEILPNLLLQRESWSLCNKLIKRDIYGNINLYPEGNMGEDMALILQMAFDFKSFSYIPKPFYFYYTNPTSITKEKSILKIYNSFRQTVDNVQLVLKVFERNGVLTEYAYELRFLQWSQKCKLLPLVGNKEYRKVWREVFPKLEYEMILDNRQSLRDRVKCLIALFNPNILRLFLK